MGQLNSQLNCGLPTKKESINKLTTMVNFIVEIYITIAIQLWWCNFHGVDSSTPYTHTEDQNLFRVSN